MRACILFWAIFLIPGFVRGGSISGVVRADAAKEMSSAGGGGGGAYDGHKMKFVERVDYAQLHDFIVFIDQPFTNTVPPDPKPVRVITQKDAIFKPLVLPVMAGTTVEWPNEDKIYHNVFSMSAGNEFDLGLYKKADPTNGWPKVVFQNAGRVDVLCSIHTKMSCTILVLGNPYFASTDARGRYSITNVPPGEYRVKAWHERLPPRSQKITVPAQGEVKLDFTLGPQAAPRPE